MPIPAFLLLPLLVLITASPMSALTITTADGVGADAYVRWATDPGDPIPDTNYGSASNLLIVSGFFPPNAFANARKVYLRFDLAALGAGGVADADLRLTFLGGDAIDTEINVWGLMDGDAGEGWGEDTITWNNAPGNTQSHWVMDLNRVVQLGSFERAADAEEFDVVTFSTASLIDFLGADTDGQVTIMLTGNSGRSVDLSSFASKESAAVGTGQASPATLEVTVPEPSAAILLALGLLAGARSRRAQA